MSDIDRRLRDEARRVHVRVPDRLAERIRAAAAAAPPAEPPLRPGWLSAAAAAVLLCAAATAWLAARPGDPARPAVAVPAPPGIAELLRVAAAARAASPGHDELAALEADLASAARTLRAAIPF